ncbi:class I SAM-dependent methyltransferase [Frondihabitans cladoniiphilus]|uniref:Methyltransferase type 11 domain-containing protein n=1 Tax=Frondihabitans cladoniiphilus TaxID=715785 RepID=A0ABP8W4B9_9MICO
MIELPYDDARFDGVLAWYSIIHTPPAELGPVLRELRRVTKPGGIALLGFQSGEGTRTMACAYGHDVEMIAHLHRVDDLAVALEAVGFEVKARLERAPRVSERHPQGFVLAAAA